MFSLAYLPTAERLTVVIVKARNLKFPHDRETGDPFVKVKRHTLFGFINNKDDKRSIVISLFSLSASFSLSIKRHLEN